MKHYSRNNTRQKHRRRHRRVLPRNFAFALLFLAALFFYEKYGGKASRWDIGQQENAQGGGASITCQSEGFLRKPLGRAQLANTLTKALFDCFFRLLLRQATMESFMMTLSPRTLSTMPRSHSRCRYSVTASLFSRAAFATARASSSTRRPIGGRCHLASLHEQMHPAVGSHLQDLRRDTALADFHGTA